MSRRKNPCLSLLSVLLLLAAGCVTVKVSLFEEPAPLKEKTISGYGRDKILLMEVSGVILEGPHRLLGLSKGVTSPSRIKEELDKAAPDDRIKAVVVKINSPGGTVSAADVILHELKAFKAKKCVPVVVCLQGLAASGGTTWPRPAIRLSPIPPASPGPSGSSP